MMDSNFFALISRMRYIARWGLMRNALPENIQEHSHMVAVLAHALGVIRRDIFHQPCDVNALATAALYHDASEILTGDLPTPIKYHNAEIMSAYHAVEDLAVQKLLGMLPPELRETYADVLAEDKDGDIYPLVKAADKLSAYIKCIEERKAEKLAILGAGMPVVIAHSFARIFYRNGFNMGLVLLEIGDDVSKINDGDTLSVDADTGVIKNLTTGVTIQCKPVPPFMKGILDKGGLVPYVKDRLAERV